MGRKRRPTTESPAAIAAPAAASDSPPVSSPWPPSDLATKVERVVDLIAEGRPSADVYQQVVLEYGVGLAPQLCEQAVLQVIQAGQAGRDFAIGFAITAATRIYREAMGIVGDGEQQPKDLEVALKAVKLIATLGERLG